ncbi:MAG: hypothetical protein ACI9CA_000437 [Natronomonas sp.]|jgi:hypothetical protein
MSEHIQAVGGASESANAGGSIQERGQLPRDDHDTREARRLHPDERAARQESRVVVPDVDDDGQTTGFYHVYSTPNEGQLGASHVRVALGGLADGAACGCRRHRHEGIRCEHIRRVAIAINETPLPAANRPAAPYFRHVLPKRVRALRHEHEERVERADGDLPERVREVAALYRAAKNALETAPRFEEETVAPKHPLPSDGDERDEPGVVDDAIEAKRVARGDDLGRFR